MDADGIAEGEALGFELGQYQTWTERCLNLKELGPTDGIAEDKSMGIDLGLTDGLVELKELGMSWY
jgi:hypothetical protein